MDIDLELEKSVVIKKDGIAKLSIYLDDYTEMKITVW